MNINETDFTKQAELYAKRMTAGMVKLKEAILAGHSNDITLLKLLADSRRLLNFIAPLLTTGEIHGLPKSVTDAADRPAPIIFRESDPTKDFGNWWQEKTSRIHALLFELVDLLNRPESEGRQESIECVVVEIERLLESILQLLGEDLKITELRLNG